MTREDLPPDWDWVTARYDCSTDTFFRALRADAEKNVEAMNAIAKKHREPWELEMAAGSREFTVSRPIAGRGNYAAVRLWSDGQTIHAERSVAGVVGDWTLDGTVTLSSDGRCRLRLADDRELDRWQILSEALQPVFFFDA